jgi:hypothetical protein
MIRLLGIQTIKDVFRLKRAALDKFKAEFSFIPSNSTLTMEYLTDAECAILANEGLAYVPYFDAETMSKMKQRTMFEKVGWSVVFEGIIYIRLPPPPLIFFYI